MSVLIITTKNSIAKPLGYVKTVLEHEKAAFLWAAQGREIEQILVISNAARHLVKGCIGISADEPDGSDNNDQNYSKHHRVFGDVLSLIGLPQHFEHVSPFWIE
jgi:hypothetical protein